MSFKYSNIHEELFSLNFVRPDKRERYQTLFQSTKGRSKLIHGFNHCGDIAFRYATQVAIEQQSPEAIQQILRQKGTPDLCYRILGIPQI